ncbi:MAG: DUF6173 family protein [Pseudomonadota bacterium]
MAAEGSKTEKAVQSQAQPAPDDIMEARLRELERQARNAGRFEAEEVCSHLVKRVVAFENALDEQHEVGIRLANFGVAAEINIRAITFRNPYLIEFSGILPNGQTVALVQHVSQLSFLLVAVPPAVEQQPYRIGFHLGPDDDEE